MTKSIRFVLLLSACALALAFGGNALAAYNPSLLVAGTSHSTGSGGPVVIGVGQDQNDDATGVLNIYAPLGYGVTLTQAPGTRIGDLEGIVKVGALGGARVPITGTVDCPRSRARTSPTHARRASTRRSGRSRRRCRAPRSRSRCTSSRHDRGGGCSSRPRGCGSAWPRRTSRRRRVLPSGASLIVAAFSVTGVFSNPNTRGQLSVERAVHPVRSRDGDAEPDERRAEHVVHAAAGSARGVREEAEGQAGQAQVRPRHRLPQ